jgi:hypothetical protein
MSSDDIDIENIPSPEVINDSYEEDYWYDEEDIERYGQINSEAPVDSIDLNRLLDMITVDHFRETRVDLASYGFIIKDDFEGILVVGDSIIVVGKDI